MFPYDILKPDEVKDLGLETNEMYAQFFLYNNEMNNAGDPINFKIYPDYNTEIANSFIGRPYLLPLKDAKGNWIAKHHRKPTVQELLEYQKKHALGEIVKTPYNQMTGNYNAIVKVFPEHHQRVEKGDIPNFTSPMLQPTDSFIGTDGKLHIKRAIGVHLQGVPKPGYAPEISGIKSVCTKGLDECMNELRIVAASGQLVQKFQSESFSNEQTQKNRSIMSQQMQPPQPPAQEGQQDSEARLAAVEKAIAELTKQLADIMKKLGESQQGAPPAPGTPPVGADGSSLAPVQQTATPPAPQTDKLTTMSSELELIKKERATEQEQLKAERLELLIQKRTQMATEIVDAKIKLHAIPIEKRDEEIKRLAELKENDEFVDLSLLHNEVTTRVKQLVGAGAGVAVYEIPSLESGDGETTINAYDISSEIGSV